MNYYRVLFTVELLCLGTVSLSLCVVECDLLRFAAGAPPPYGRMHEYLINFIQVYSHSDDEGIVSYGQRSSFIGNLFSTTTRISFSGHLTDTDHDSRCTIPSAQSNDEFHSITFLVVDYFTSAIHPLYIFVTAARERVAG